MVRFLTPKIDRTIVPNPRKKRIARKIITGIGKTILDDSSNRNAVGVPVS